MRVIGIDPGTRSFDFFGMDSDTVIVDDTIPAEEVGRDPETLLHRVRALAPLDMIVGPSGYGLPVTSVKDATDRELSLMLPRDYGDVSVNEGIKNVFRLMKDEGLPLHFTPGVVHLPTVPAYRKANRLDMGTADKLCCVALAMKDQAERHAIDYPQTSFLLVEAGHGFTAVIGVQDGKVVDGIGGTCGGPGFLTLGGMDSELAIRIGVLPQAALFTGGAKDVAGKEGLTPEELAEAPESYPNAWQMLLEGITKDVAAMTVSCPRPREIILSGRLSRIAGIRDELHARLATFGPVRSVVRTAEVAKEAAEGAYLLGEGLLGGEYKGIVDCLELRKATGTMYGHIYMKGTGLPEAEVAPSRP